MTQKGLVFLEKAFSNFKILISEDHSEATIVNPIYEENIMVYYEEEDDYSPFIAGFSFQHCHLRSEEEVIAWIEDIISGKSAAIEFFREGQRFFGGEIDAVELENLSYEKLEQHTDYYGTTKLLEMADSFKVRAWNPEGNFDGMFVFEQDGTIKIEKDKNQCQRVLLQ